MNKNDYKLKILSISKNKKYKLYAGGVIGAVVLAIGLATVLSIHYQEVNLQDSNDNNSNITKSINEMSLEEKDESYAMLQVDVNNIDYLNENSDLLAIVRDGKYIVSGVSISNQSQTSNFVALKPGEYNIQSQTGMSSTFKVDNIDQNFILTVDYATGEMNVTETTTLNFNR